MCNKSIGNFFGELAIRDRDEIYGVAAQLLQRNLDDVRGQRQHLALTEIEVEIDNIRSAWHWAIEYRHLNEIGKMLDSRLNVAKIHRMEKESSLFFFLSKTAETNAMTKQENKAHVG